MSERVTVTSLRRKKERGEKIVMVTCYDYPFARLVDQAGVDMVLVGDSLGDNVLGYDNTLPVTLDEMIHHARAVCRGIERAFVLVDLPFMSYQVSPEQALESAGRVLKETAAEAVKLEGGVEIAPTVARLVSAGIPVVGHVGFTPQSVKQFGGYRMQGGDAASEAGLTAGLDSIVQAGAFAVVLELVSPHLAKTLTEKSPIPTIGIGAGPHCDGQVQVLHDLLGLYPERTFRHAKRYTEAGRATVDAVAQYAAEVRSGSFPAVPGTT